MSETEAKSQTKAAPVSMRRSPRAKPYLRLLWLIPTATIFAVGLWKYLDVEPGGTVESIRLMTKPGPVGQAAEALRLVTGTFDLYLRVKTLDGESKTPTYKDTAIGNGLQFTMPRPSLLKNVKQVDVFDEHMLRSDKNLDHINVDDQWAAEGQMFRIELQGKPNEPVKWALPTMAVGAALSALVILRFVWDQVV